MSSSDDLPGAAARSALIAGPLFLGLLLLIELQQSVPETLEIGVASLPGLVGPLVFMAFASLIVGVVLAFPTCLVAGGALWFLADNLPLARAPVVWIAAGAGLAVAILHILFGGVDSSGSYAFIATAMACAAVVRSRLRWE